MSSWLPPIATNNLVQSALKNYQLAIDSYIEAHKIYPAMESPIIMIERLKKLINNETVWIKWLDL